MRLAFQVTAERVKAVLAETAILKLAGGVQSRLVTALNAPYPEAMHLNREQFTKLLKKSLAVYDVALSGAELKALLGVLGDRHPEANLCQSKGEVEADSGLQDYENVPLGEEADVYFEREVQPHVPEVWIDHKKCDELDGEVGFEIPFNHHFYVFQPPRLLEEIDRDLKDCTDRIKQMIEELSA